MPNQAVPAVTELLAPSEPEAFEVINGDSQRPVLLVCDHASRRIPATLGDLGLSKVHLTDHIAWDIGAGPVTRLLSEQLGATAVLANYSRLVVDLNRSPGDVGAVPPLSDGVIVPGNLSLSDENRQRRIDALFHPYHQAVSGELNRLSKDQMPVLVSIHSFTPNLHGQPRPWSMGVLWEKDPRLPLPLLASLRQDGLLVGDNEPYSGHHPADYTIDHHAEPAGFAHAGIEIRQDLIGNAQNQADYAELLGNALTIVLENPALYRRRG